MFFTNFDLFQFMEGTQPHIQNGFCLHISQLKRRHQLLFRLILISNDTNNFVQIQESNQKAFEHF